MVSEDCESSGPYCHHWGPDALGFFVRVEMLRGFLEQLAHTILNSMCFVKFFIVRLVGL